MRLIQKEIIWNFWHLKVYLPDFDALFSAFIDRLDAILFEPETRPLHMRKLDWLPIC